MQLRGRRIFYMHYTKKDALLRRLIFASLFSAMSIVFGKYLAFTMLTVRISFENLPVLASGIMLGPVWAGAVGAVADLVGCVLVGYEINPIITAGAALNGIVAGVVARALRGKRALRIPVSVASAHLLGSVLLKSLGFYVYYGTPYLAVMLERLGVYALISAAEIIMLGLLFSNKSVKIMTERL